MTLGEAIGRHAEAAVRQLDEVDDGATDSDVDSEMSEMLRARARGQCAPVVGADTIDTRQLEAAALAPAPSPDAEA